MNSKTLVKKYNLSKEALDRVSQCIKKAESKISGEIVLAVAAESDDYSIWELFAALAGSLAVTIFMMPFAERIRAFYESLNWTAPEWYLPAIYTFTSFFLVLAFFGLINLIPALDRLVIPRGAKNKAVNNTALRAFCQQGVYDTRERTGILIYVSFLEKQARVLADKGIAKKIGPDLWRLIVNGLAEEIGKKNVEGAFCEAVEKCGELLAQYFPADKDNNPDELDDGVVILER